MTLLDTALAYAQAGCSVVPLATDGRKLPAVPWKAYQTSRPDEQQLASWFTGRTYDGLGIVCGAVSGGLEMIEVEGHAARSGLATRLGTSLADHGLGDIWSLLVAGHMESTPSGGFHWLYRVEDGVARGNLKLARRPATPEELEERPDDRVKVLIETRGEGGFTVLAPSAGRSHPSGKPWVLMSGGPASIPVLTVEQRDTLHALAGMFDSMPAAAPRTQSAPSDPTTPAATDSLRPGDAYNASTDWRDILEPAGWTEGHNLGKARTWIRPGKDHREGISATSGRNDGDNLYVFSTATELPSLEALSKFHVFTLLHHNGDFKAAAKSLRAAGYGAALEPSSTVTPTTVAAALGNATPPDRPAAIGQNVPPQPSPQAAPTALLVQVDERTLERSDDGNALALVNRFGNRIRYCHDRGRWLAWDGHRWQWCERGGGVVREYAKRIARSLPEDDSPALTHKRRSLGAVGTSAMLTQAATDPSIAVTLDDLDAHPWELNTPAGIVDLRTGTVGPADPDRLHTRITLCAPDSTADPGRWQEFLTDTFADDQALISYLKRLVGYSSVGLVGAHVLPFCHGSGGNGKGVFLEAIQKTLGDYATTAPSGFLMATANAKHETEIARLAGARMVLCSEVNEGDHFDEAKVKQLTGGDTLTARFMQQDHFTFTPTHQLWLMGNAKPAVRSGGRSFWRRLRLIPFEREVPKSKEIDDLQGLLAHEHGPALLHWIVTGAAQYHQRGLSEPDTVRVATDDYAHDQDTVSRFLEEQCLLGGGEHVQAKVGIVRSAYERWCIDAGEVPISAKAFGLALQRAGVDSRRSKTARFYVGIKVLNDDENASPDAWLGGSE